VIVRPGLGFVFTPPRALRGQEKGEEEVSRELIELNRPGHATTTPERRVSDQTQKGVHGGFKGFLYMIPHE